MTWIVEMDGKQLDVDPLDFTGLELSLIKQRTGLAFRPLLAALADLDGDAWRVLFWIADRRDNQELKFTDYAGPSMRLITANIDGLDAALESLEDLGKAPTPETDGFGSSPSSSDIPEALTTP